MINNLSVPKHIAVIMDGNGRWAEQKMLPKKIGHRQGMIAVEKLIKSCQKYGVEYLTLYAFSSENWNRPQAEIIDLMDLLKEYLETQVTKLIEQNVRIIFIGDHYKLDEDIRLLMHASEEKSRNNQFVLRLAVSYGARNEIRNAAVNMAQYILENSIDINSINIELFDKFININNIPDPDLLIRTSGEYRVSNFLLWHIAYTELYFTDKLWPDFTEQDFIKALENFNSRERRYGK